MSNPWTCWKCDQRNVGWVEECGRCEAPRFPLIKIDGHDDAIYGVSDVRTGTVTRRRLCYSGEVIIQTLMKRDGMSREEAMEFMEFNIEGGIPPSPSAPLIFWPLNPEEFEEMQSPKAPLQEPPG